MILSQRVFIYLLILSKPISIFSSELAKQNRTKPSPLLPKNTPGHDAT